MTSKLLQRLLAGALLPIAIGLGGASSADLRVVAPSTPGSSWDQIAQALRAAVADGQRGPAVEVINAPGAGGTVGLARFVADAADADLLVTGAIMLDASLLHRAPVGLDRMTPIARLVVEPFAVVVPAESALKSLGDLKAELGADAARVGWAGGPVGGIDHVAALLLARAMGVEAPRLNYAPFLTSAEAAAAVAEGRVGVAVLSLSEVAVEIDTGRIRTLGISGEVRLNGIAAPTLSEAGINLDIVNWRGLVARPGLPAEQRARLATLAGSVFASAEWQAMIARKRWQNAFMGPEAFGAFLAIEHGRAKSALKAAGLLKRED